MRSPKQEAERDAGREDQVSVRIAKPFAVGRFRVTRAEFAAFIAPTKYKSDDRCVTSAEGRYALQLDLNWRSPGFSQTDNTPSDLRELE